jgi:hypothetical protein
MNRVDTKYRQIAGDIMVSSGRHSRKGTAGAMSVLLAHRPPIVLSDFSIHQPDDVTKEEAWPIFIDIFLKWDFENHRPFHKGAKRSWSGGG